MFNRLTILASLGAVALLASGCFADSSESEGTAANSAALSSNLVYVPIGGGYDTFGAYSKVVARQAHGRSVDILLVPSAYDEDKATAIDNGDYDLALEHVTEASDACNAIVDKKKFPDGCKVSLLELWTADDAASPAIVAALKASSLDSLYFLGGDQGAAMLAIAGTKAEAAMRQAFYRGVVQGGTSAGDAVQSRVMNNGYTDLGDYNTGLQLGALDIWWGDKSAPNQRGLSYGSELAIFDQHLYQRGRFGRLLNEVARTADHFGNGGLIGFGADFDTAAVQTGSRISEVFGPSSVTVVDFATLNTRYAWVGSDGKPVANPSFTDTPTAALSAKNILTHVLAGKADDVGSAASYDLLSRLPFLNGLPYPIVGTNWIYNHFSCNHLRSSRPILLGGDHSLDDNWPSSQPALVELVNRAGKSGKFLIVAAAYDTTENAQIDIDNYTQALKLSGWTGPVSSVVYGSASLNANLLNDTAGVLFLGGNQALLAPALSDKSFTSFVQNAKSRTPIVMLERAMTAAAGSVYDAIDDASDPIEAFLANNAVINTGLGLVDGKVAFEPRLQYDYRYGRLYGIPFKAQKSRPVVFGISENTALLVGPEGATVIGQNPVIMTDSAWATFYTGENGAIGAFNVLVDVYEPAQRIGRKGNRRLEGGLSRRDTSDEPRNKR